jgi:hypothetical protein
VGIARKVARDALEDSSTCIINTPTPMKYMPSGNTPGCPPPPPSPPTSGGAGALNAAFATSASSSTRPAAARSPGCSCDALKEPRFTAPDGVGDDGDDGGGGGDMVMMGMKAIVNAVAAAMAVLIW